MKTTKEIVNEYFERWENHEKPQSQKEVMWRKQMGLVNEELANKYLGGGSQWK